MKITRSCLLFCYLAVSIILASCNEGMARSYTETPHVLDLLEPLLAPDDFSAQWKWNSSELNQHSDIPSAENNYSTGYATSSLIGYYEVDGENFYFMVFHLVQEYERSVPLISDSVLNQSFTYGGIGTSFEIDTVEIGDLTDSRCTRDVVANNQMFMCEILVQYASVESFLRVTGDLSIGQQALNNIINQILISIDGHIEFGK